MKTHNNNNSTTTRSSIIFLNYNDQQPHNKIFQTTHYFVLNGIYYINIFKLKTTINSSKTEILYLILNLLNVSCHLDANTNALVNFVVKKYCLLSEYWTLVIWPFGSHSHMANFHIHLPRWWM